MKRPASFDFALDFLGSPESEEMLTYVESLEQALALRAKSTSNPRFTVGSHLLPYGRGKELEVFLVVDGQIPPPNVVHVGSVDQEVACLAQRLNEAAALLDENGYEIRRMA